jgi:hypothetical protein
LLFFVQLQKELAQAKLQQAKAEVQLLTSQKLYAAESTQLREAIAALQVLLIKAQSQATEADGNPKPAGRN